jgi:hypothetical protein
MAETQLAARAAAARGLFRKAGLAIDENDPRCWVVRRGDRAAAAPWLFWPDTGLFRSVKGGRAGYTAAALVRAIG